MAPPPWTTPEQREFLTAQLPLFIQRQAEGKLHLFWPPLMEAWFQKYPEHTLLNLPLPADKDGRELTPDELARLGAAIKARRSKIENWIRNQRKKIGSAAEDAVPSTTNAMVQRIFHLSVPRRRRVHQPIEIFQKRNKVAIVEALTAAGYDALNVDQDPDEADDWTDEFQDTPAARAKRTRSARMRMRTRVVQDMWAEASPEERAAVEAAIEEEKRALTEEEQRAELDPQQATPEERLQAIDSLDAVFGGVHRAAYLASGWVGMSIFGGPNPRMNGDLTLKIVCFGKTPSGNDFEACCMDFDKNITQPFQDFLTICFGETDTADWALPTTPEVAMDHAPVRRIVVTHPVAEPEIAKKPKKSKSKSKSKKSKKDVNVEGTVSPPSNQHTGRVTGPGDAFSEPSPPPSRCPSPGAAEDYADSNPSPSRDPSPDAADDYGDFDVSPSQNFDMYGVGLDLGTTAPSWPSGMTPPLTPEVAEAIARQERGGTINHASMVIDPQLLDGAAPFVPMPPAFSPAQPILFASPLAPPSVPPPFSPATLLMLSPIVSPPVSTPVPLKPRPARKNTPFAPSASVFGLPDDPYRRSNLFEAFRSSTTPQTTPQTPQAASPATTSLIDFGLESRTTPPSKISLSLLKSTVPSAKPAALSSRPTRAAQLVAGVIDSHPPATTPVPTPPVAYPAPPPLFTPSSPATTAPPTPTPPTPPTAAASPPIFDLPGSRPQCNPLPLPKPAKIGKKPPPRKMSAAETAKNKAAAATALKIALVQGEVQNKKRGRPRKEPLLDITNEVTSATNASTSAASDAVSTGDDLPSPNASAPPIYVVSSTNNNRAAAREAARKEKAAEEKAAADAAAAQAAKGWTEMTVDGATVVTFTSTRVRRAAKHPDGSAVEPETKKARTVNTKKTDASLTKLLERGEKRKAAELSKPKGKKRRT
ncbi:hypothetical protein C8R45DRAFT_1221666 [Mycena sanguinolenta]|nr:hypothetical protein C8R45DRAFT_1221666 [Mycena sanguinolenta]